ncbi:MAG: hypothetical protein ACTS73_08535 [Arsenophonus sp. NEOnobi-MAG3]
MLPAMLKEFLIDNPDAVLSGDGPKRINEAGKGDARILTLSGQEQQAVDY